MSTTTATNTRPAAPPPSSSFSVAGRAMHLLALAVINAIAIWLIYGLVSGSFIGVALATAVAIITIGLNVIILREDLYPLRWLSPGLALMIVLVIYPVLFTVFISFTNYGTGHLVGQAGAIEALENVTYTPEGALTYSYAAYRSASGEFLLWITPPADSGETSLLVGAGQIIEPSEVSAGAVDADGIPANIPGYQRLSTFQILPYLSDLDGIEFGEPPNAVRVTSSDTATAATQRYLYDPANDTMTDQTTGIVYRPVNGTFTSDEGQTLNPGFFVTTGLNNYTRLFLSPAFAGPFILIFVWTVAYAILSVILTFALGLFLAIVYDDNTLPSILRKLIRSMLIIPYAIPAFIGVQIWRSMLNPQYGVVNSFLGSLFGAGPAWFTDPIWAKVGILLVQSWLGFPYMLLICTGALKSVPKDLYEAAQVDGAGVWYQFRRITLPLVLVTVSPLLIASFAFNFNNFTVIDIYNQGNPPIANSPTPAGHTDILISYTFRLAFGSGGADYGYASAITVIIFIVLSIITFSQFRRTQRTEEGI